MSFDIQPWSPDVFPLNARIGVFGRTASGKTFLVCDLIVKNRHRFDDIVIVCPGRRDAEKYRDLSPSIIILYEFNEETLEFLRALQERQLRASTGSQSILTDCSRQLYGLAKKCFTQ